MKVEDVMGRLPLHLACHNSVVAVEALGSYGTDFAAQD